MMHNKHATTNMNDRNKFTVVGHSLRLHTTDTVSVPKKLGPIGKLTQRLANIKKIFK